MRQWQHKLKHEIQELVPVTLFFFVGFQLLALTQALMLGQYGIRAWAFVAATLGALIVAKVVVIADHFKFVNRFPDKPLIHNIAWKTAIYFAGSWVVRYAEQLIYHWRHTGSFAEANRELLDKVVWHHVLVIQMWLLVLLLAFCTLREFGRAIGTERIVAMMLSEPPNADCQAAAAVESTDFKQVPLKE